MNRKLSEIVRVDQVVTPVDIATDRTGVYLPLADYRQVMATVTTDTVAATKNVTVQLFQAKDAAGTGAKALSALVTKVAATGGEKITLSVEANTSKLEKGYTHVTAQVTSDTAVALLGAAVLVRGGGRFGTGRA